MDYFSCATRRAPAMIAAVVLLLAAGVHADEIYKWVDKEGKTHYSSRKEDAQGAAATTLRSQPPPPIDAGAPAAARAANEDVIRRRPAEARLPKDSPSPVVPQPVERNHVAEGDAGRCQLARGILSGEIRHHSGAPLDAYDKQTAENDVRAFCGK